MKKSRILVTPENLQSFSRSIAQAAGELEQLANRLQQSANQLDWEAATKPRVEARVAEMTSKVRILLQKASDLQNSLNQTAQSFLTADQAGATGISGISRQFSDWQRFYKGSVSSLNQIRDGFWFEREQALGWHDRYKDLDDLKKEIEKEDGSFQDPLRRIFYLDSKIGSLQRERDDLARQAGNLFNIFKRDELDGEISKLDTEIARLGQIKDDYSKYYLLNDMIKTGSTNSPLKGEDIPAFNKSINSQYPRDDGAGLDSNCTWYAAAAVQTATGHQLPNWHDAGQWAVNAADFARDNPGGMVAGVDAIPEAGSVLCDTNLGSHGHVMYVESVHLSPDGKKWEVTVSEENWLGGSIGKGERISLEDPNGSDVGRWRRTISLEIDPESNPPAVKDSSLQFIHFDTSITDSREPPKGPIYA